LFNADPTRAGEFWMTREYLPGFLRLSKRETEEGLLRLRHDLDSGAWHARHAGLLALDELDLGYCIARAELAS
jgi:hypothetical protein